MIGNIFFVTYLLENKGNQPVYHSLKSQKNVLNFPIQSNINFNLILKRLNFIFDNISAKSHLTEKRKKDQKKLSEFI